MDNISRPTLARAAAVALAAAFASADPALARKAPESPIEYGPPPTIERFQELAEQAVRARLVDPDSAKFSWLWGFNQGYYKPLLLKRVHGYYGCGLVNARNRMGGYTGNTYFIVVIDHDMVLFAELAQNTYSLIGEHCVKAKLPLLASFTTPPPARPIFGVKFQIVSEGIYVLEVFAASPAEQGGVKPGMVITAVNGIALKGMTMTSAQQLLSNITGSADLELVGGQHLKVTRP